MTDGMNITAPPSLHQMTVCIREGRQGAVIVPGSAAVAGPFPQKEEEALAGLLLEAGFFRLFFCSADAERDYEAGRPAAAYRFRDGEPPLSEGLLSLPFRRKEQGEAVLYFPACAEEAGCLALAAEEAGLHGAAFWPMPSGGVILSSFGGGTASSLIVPAQGALPEGEAGRLLFTGALIAYGAGLASTFLGAADRMRRAYRRKR